MKEKYPLYSHHSIQILILKTSCFHFPNLGYLYRRCNYNLISNAQQIPNIYIYIYIYINLKELLHRAHKVKVKGSFAGPSLHFFSDT